MSAIAPRWLWLALGAASAGLVVASLLLTAWLNLQPCHLCIFQRLLFMLLAALGVLAFLAGGAARLVVGSLTLPLSALGMGVATYQSWLQRQPVELAQGCAVGQAGWIEQVVEWLGQRAPSLFMATGFCADEELVVLGLSLANWALVAFAVFLALAGWAITAQRRGR